MCGFIAYRGESKTVLKEVSEQFSVLKHRGPDNTQELKFSNGYLGFHRLSIMDPSQNGHQPLWNHSEETFLVCNGEIYNHKKIREEIQYTFKSSSDCEVILALYETLGADKLVNTLDGEFAFVIFDQKKNRILVARDPLGIRPMFYGYTENEDIIFASEMKALHKLCKEIKPFPPAHYFDGKTFKRYCDPCAPRQSFQGTDSELFEGIHDTLTKAVRKRLHSDVPVGFLLSGGLDSSLVCSIAQKESSQPIRTFAIGMEHDAIDLKYAAQVAKFLKTDHTEVIISKTDVLDAIETTIWHLESWDTTTIRASIGMFLICKSIKEKTDIKVLLTGEVSDELFGYKYTDYAPSADAFQKEAQKRIREIHMYDVLRADRCIAAHSLEARVPFSDQDFVQFVMDIPPEKKMNTYNMGKYLLRQAFAKGDYLPQEILFRDKAAFSDAVGHSLVDEIKRYANSVYSSEEFNKAVNKYQHAPPKSKEALLYRDIFEKFYPKREKLISDFWLPNKEWEHCNIDDPSARFLPNYGNSGT